MYPSKVALMKVREKTNNNYGLTNHQWVFSVEGCVCTRVELSAF